MICPKCKCEYIDGVTHCAECDVDLVESLAEARDGSSVLLADADLHGVWGGRDVQTCAAICTRLKAAGIPFRVTERSREFLTATEQYLEIGVPPEELDRAKEIAGGEYSDYAEDEDAASALELPAEDDEAEDNEAEVEERENNWDPANWHPEDADREVWRGGTAEQAATIEACLSENNIHSRVDGEDDAPRKVFVMQEDEARAKEIVREIEEGRPLK
jgi:hypothetical protein